MYQFKVRAFIRGKGFLDSPIYLCGVPQRHTQIEIDGEQYFVIQVLWREDNYVYKPETLFLSTEA